MQSDSKKSAPSFLKEALLVMFATPASVGVLDKINERLDIGRLLERVILNYKKITEEFWNLIFTTLDIQIPTPIDLFSFCIFILLPVLTSFILYRKKPSSGDAFKSERNIVSILWGILSAVFVIIFSYIFGVFDYLIEGATDYFTISSMIISYLSIYSAILALFFIVAINKNASLLVDRISCGHKNYVILTLLIIGIIFFLTFKEKMFSFAFEIISNYHKIIVDPINYLFFIYLIGIAILSIVFKLRGPAYIGLWSAGIYLIDWASRNGIPKINSWLESIGA